MRGSTLLKQQIGGQQSPRCHVVSGLDGKFVGIFEQVSAHQAPDGYFNWPKLMPETKQESVVSFHAAARLRRFHPTMALNASLAHEEAWSEASIRRRKLKLLKTALDVWPRPLLEATTQQSETV